MIGVAPKAPFFLGAAMHFSGEKGIISPEYTGVLKKKEISQRVFFLGFCPDHMNDSPAGTVLFF